ncbi:hypothetical protein [Massilia sp. PWRC2]|uniref:hypothetical protein n=1 Tax=Massilia sp. PWRC2 TaxID=2804626 RepID=UPI003CF50A12
MSLADDFISVMAHIKAIEPDSDDPMRFAMWDCNCNAENIISHVLVQAEAVARIATSIRKDWDAAMAEKGNV